MNGGASPDSPVKWDNSWPDLTKPAAGYPILEGVEHYDVFRTTEELGIYNHHPHICYHNGVFYATWSNQRYGEDGPGQRVLCATSKDGKTWTEAKAAVPSLWSVKPFARPKELGRVTMPVACFAIDGTVYVIAHVYDICWWQKPDDTLWFQRFGHGNIARELKPNGDLGDIFWLEDYPPEPYPGTLDISPARDPQFRDRVKRINEYINDPMHPRVWDFRRQSSSIHLPGGYDLCEPVVYKRPDGVLVKLWRASGLVHRMFGSVSEDRGATWTIPVRTGIPDSAAKTVAGTLPDGRNYLVGNQITGPIGDEQPGHYKRDPLTIALSDDGITFNRVASIRHNAPNTWRCGPTTQVTGRGCGYQYPYAIIVDGAMWVIYSVGKEDIAVSRVPLDALP